VEQKDHILPHICGKCQFRTNDDPFKQKEFSATESVEPLGRDEETAAPTVSRAPAKEWPSQSAEKLPGEMWLLVFDILETEELMAFDEAFPSIGGVITKFNVIQSCELRCFCLKKGYMNAKLGVGIAVSEEEKGNLDWVGSEYDLLSEEAFNMGKFVSPANFPVGKHCLRIQ